MKKLAPWLLLLTSAIWGFAFVAQRKGMEFSGPLTFNGLRFMLGALTLLLLKPLTQTKITSPNAWFNPILLLHASLASVALFFGSTFQQVGLVYTTAGKAGFITSTYIVLVPLYGVVKGNRPSWQYWFGIATVLTGLFLLTNESDYQLRMGDLLVLISAVYWAMHIVLLSKVAASHNSISLAFWQFLFTGIFSLTLGLLLEISDWQLILGGWWPLVYAGVFSAGIGFTLQVAAQKHVKPEFTGVILSLEALFAAIGGFFLMHERMEMASLVGCGLMLVGLMVAQYKDQLVA